MMALATDYRGAQELLEQRHDALARSESELEGQKEWLRALCEVQAGAASQVPANIKIA